MLPTELYITVAPIGMKKPIARMRPTVVIDGADVNLLDSLSRLRIFDKQA